MVDFGGMGCGSRANGLVIAVRGYALELVIYP